MVCINELVSRKMDLRFFTTHDIREKLGIRKIEVVLEKLRANRYLENSPHTFNGGDPLFMVVTFSVCVSQKTGSDLIFQNNKRSCKGSLPSVCNM